ncbi:hypothetical protein BU23DRAFT_575781 [Bimuria novae-zelandiae CBS 107.79]|uniref:Uncharacterized protein n=1 Tax=Bimuria novae-zelandiae CBS 107.79 TaxID=1447943 RepID=A0A6A5UIY9_9PLEO|nr:hypothetical protein BU23DRAFT_575781 [Bimuria novae-zelandiae CBS 107.79]
MRDAAPEIEYVAYSLLLRLIKSVYQMKVQCVHQVLEYVGELEEFATPTFEIVSHFLGGRQFSSIEIGRFAPKATATLKYGVEWDMIQDPLKHDQVSQQFLMDATDFAAASSPMSHLNTLWLFSAPILGGYPVTADHALQRAVQHLVRMLRDRGISINLIIVVIRHVANTVAGWNRCSEARLFRISFLADFGGLLKDIDVSDDVTLTEEEQMDMVKLGADKIVKFKHYESQQLGNLHMYQPAVTAFKQTRQKRRDTEEELKKQKAKYAGLSSSQKAKRKFVEKCAETQRRRKRSLRSRCSNGQGRSSGYNTEYGRPSVLPPARWDFGSDRHW